MHLTKKIALIASTGASVVKTVFNKSERNEFDLALVITDRSCGAADFARDNEIPLIQLSTNDTQSLSSKIQDALDLHGIDYAYLFFTRLLSGDVLTKYKNKIINFHPSLLPACPGLHGFEDTIRSGSILAGSTIHFVDDGMDTGKQIMQTFTSTIGIEKQHLRHIIFAQQCAALYEVHRKLQSGGLLPREELKQQTLEHGFIPNIDQESMRLYRAIL
jgi:phosphoribosylglycinamide formyltransferase-1